MQATTELYKSILADPRHLKEHRAFVGDVEYGPSDIITEAEAPGVYLQQSPLVTGSLYPGGIPGIGGCVSRQLDIMVRPKGDIPRMAEIKMETRLVLRDPLTGANTQESEWLPKGTFYIDTRKKDKVTGLLIIHAYDAMLKAEEVYITADDQETSWPRESAAVVEEIAGRLGLELDARTVLNTSYMMDWPIDYTMRELLSFVAVANCGNWIVSDSGTLYLVPFCNADADVADVGMNAKKLDTSPIFPAYSGVTLLLDEENAYYGGDDSGRMLEGTCPFGTKEMAVAMSDSIQGFVYQPYEALGAILDPAAELGDTVSIGGITGVLASITTTFTALMPSDIAAPADEEVEHEYPYTSPETREINRKLATTRSQITKTAEEIKLLVEATDGRVSEIQQTVDGITMEVSQQAGADGQVYSRITLTIGPNSYSGLIKMDGNLDVSGQLSADALYAAIGDIADLTVNRLSTSRRILMYLAKDMSDDNYIRIHDEQIEFVSGTTDGSTEQATTPDGLPIYWEADVSEAEIASNGYPYIDGTRIFTTTKVTDWPVYVYSYTELVKSSQHFEMVGEHYLPIWTFGAGDDTGYNKGWLVKEAEAMKLLYRTGAGKDLGLIMNNTGYMDAYGLRRASFLDFSELPFGKFYEMVEGLDKEYSYTVERDDLGRPVKIIDDEDGHAMEVRWWQQ